MWKVFLLLVAMSFIACADGPNKKPVVNNTQTEFGDTVWTSMYTDGSIRIDRAFKFIGSQDTSTQYCFSKYYVWHRDDGTLLYVCDWKSKSTWSYPKDNDGLLGKKNNPEDPDLLNYRPFQYAIWKVTSPKAIRILTKLGLKVPEPFAKIETVKMSESRNSAFWIAFMEETDPDYKGWEGIDQRATSVITIQ
jgi:hypothetical protein